MRIDSVLLLKRLDHLQNSIRIQGFQNSEPLGQPGPFSGSMGLETSTTGWGC